VPSSEGFQPRFGGFWVDVTDAIRERRGQPLQFSEDPFDSIPISVATYLKSESSSLQCGLEVLGAINEKDSRFDIVLVPQFVEENICE